MNCSTDTTEYAQYYDEVLIGYTEIFDVLWRHYYTIIHEYADENIYWLRQKERSGI